jgi:hypothetical protein
MRSTLWPPHREEASTRSRFPLAGDPAAPHGMSRRHPNQTSCAAPASAEIGPGHNERARPTAQTTPARPPPEHQLDVGGHLQIGGNSRFPPCAPFPKDAVLAAGGG